MVHNTHGKEIRVGPQRLLDFLTAWRKVIGNGMTEEELCVRVGLAKGTISAWRTQGSRPKPETIEQLAPVVCDDDVSLDDLFRLAGYGTTEVWAEKGTPEEYLAWVRLRRQTPEAQKQLLATLHSICDSIEGYR